MKKSMIALAVLAAAAGTAQAATSVTLYGRADVGYSRTTTKDVVDGAKVVQGGTTEGENRLGIKGQEDLGNGYAATFQLEGRFDGSTGAKSVTSTGTALNFFDRESTVGVKTPYGSLRFGRSLASMERGLGFANIGRRSLDISPYASAARQSNAAFYDATFGAVSFGGHVTTQGLGGNEVNITAGQSAGLTATGYDEATTASVSTGSDKKAAYGAYAKYAANGLTASLAYQKDGANALRTKEWGVGLGYTMNPVFVNATYASLKDASSDKLNTLYANLGANIGANDTVAVVYKDQKVKPNVSSSLSTKAKTTTLGLAYVHALSKRTSVYANVSQVKTTTNGTTSTASTTTKKPTWDIALRHNF